MFSAKEMFEACLNDENKLLLKLKKREIVEMIINKEYTKEELETIKENDFARFQLQCYENELMEMSKGELIFKKIQNYDLKEQTEEKE